MGSVERVGSQGLRAPAEHQDACDTGGFDDIEAVAFMGAADDFNVVALGVIQQGPEVAGSEDGGDVDAGRRIIGHFARNLGALLKGQADRFTGLADGLIHPSDCRAADGDFSDVDYIVTVGIQRHH